MDYIGREFNSEIFKDLNLTGKSFIDSRFTDCTFRNCNISNVAISNTRFLNTKFIECKILGINFTNCDHFLMKVYFEKCIIQASIFNNLELKNTVFRDNRIYESDFGYSNLTNSDFSGSDLKDTIFQNTNLTGVSFRNAINYNINPTTNQIRKAKFSNPEVIALLDIFDIDVE